MAAYFGWRVASVCCFSNDELNYLRVLFRLPLRSLVEYYEYEPVGMMGGGNMLGQKLRSEDILQMNSIDFYWSCKDLDIPVAFPAC